MHVAWLLIACGSFEADPPVRMFAIEGGAHEQLSCESCHGPPPFGSLNTDCASCHEADRKDPNHFAGQTCDGAEGCHTVEDNAWADAAGNIEHDFLPLEGSHAGPCENCHAAPEGGFEKALVGVSNYCWNCHEADRPDDGHYASELDPKDPFFRWDCGPCHGNIQFTQGFRFHSERVPHGAIVDDGAGTCTTSAPETWQYDCEGCHPVSLKEFVCLECHEGVHPEQNYQDAVCTGCHVSGGPDLQGECDSLP